MARRPVEDEATRLARERIERYRSAPPRWALIARPFGYLLASAVWLTLLAVACFLPLILPIELSDSGWATGDALAESDPVTVGVYVVVIGVVVAPLLGYVFLAMPITAGALVVLSLTYVVRSLRPSYRGERLSATGWSSGAIGLYLFPPALSLIPVRMTRWSRFWTGAYIMGWLPSGATFLAAVAFGIGYFVTVAWLFWPPDGPIGVVGPILSILSLVTAGVLLVRAVRRRFLLPPDDEES